MSLQNLRAILAVSAILLASGQAAGQAAGASMELSAGTHRIVAEVVQTPAARAQGLMHRESMPANSGMLFVFPEAGVQCFWMKNTLIPLSIAFLDDNGRIVNIADMQPQSLDTHCSWKPVRFALEMNAGWFRKRGIPAGSNIAGLDKAPPGY